MIDIRLNEDFLRHYKTRALRKRLGADAVLSLQALWIWAAVYRTEGVLYKMDDTKIESAAEWDGQEGKFISALIELEWLDKLEDGTYALHQWTEHQPWAADFANRSDKARLSSMGKNYPELYEELIAQGYTGIDSASYAELTAEYNRRGILRHSSAFQRIASESLAPKPTPTPAPSPTPSPVHVPSKTPKTRKAIAKAPASSSSSSGERGNTQIHAQTQQAESTIQAKSVTKAESTAQAESKASIKPKTAPITNTKTPETTPAEPELSAGQYVSEDAVEATVVDVLTQWNLQLARLGFPEALRITKRRESAFKARIRCSQERIYLSWWVALFDKIAASDFMCESARQKANWLTLDWVLNEQNMMKILEGKYDSQRPVIADIFHKHNKHNHVQEVSCSAAPDEVTTDGTGCMPEDVRRRMSDIYRLMHGTNEGNLYEKTFSETIEAELSPESNENMNIPDTVQNTEIEGATCSYDRLEGEMLAVDEEYYQSYLEELDRISAEYVQAGENQ